MTAVDDARHEFDDHVGFSTLSDVELVAGIEHCHFDAIADIYERHSAHVHALAVEIWGTRRADQIVQDVFMRLWQAPAAFDPGHGSLAVHLTMQVRLWVEPAGYAAAERRCQARLSEALRLRSGQGLLHRRITEGAFSCRRTQPPGS